MSWARSLSVVNWPGELRSVVARDISPACSNLVMVLAVCCLVVLLLN